MRKPPPRRAIGSSWRWPLATPDCAFSDPVAAQRQLAELLARPETMLPVERLLATVELKEVEQRLILQAENQRLRDEAPPDDREKLQADQPSTFGGRSDENARLRKALDEARAKLEAITHIERSITDQRYEWNAYPIRNWSA